MIYYKKETRNFFIRNLREVTDKLAYIVLIKLTHTYTLKKSEIIYIGDCTFVFKPRDDHIEITKLESRNSQGTIENKFLTTDGPITIGRDKNCTINFPNSKSFSKVHVTTFYDFDEKTWKIHDGSQGKESTNGTW